MYEENRRISWTNLFIKGIIVIIFILFTVWLLSLSTRDLSRSLNVLTDEIFSTNMEKMKDVGTSYFTTERLPESVGDIKTLTLAKMYEKNLILELKDKNGNTCSAENSYVSVEKMENEYQMKVYLECGNENHYTVTIMGCYNYCENGICERETKENATLEYEYKKTTGGYWTPWGSFSDWSKVSVDKTNYRDVEVKTVKEDYSYEKYEIQKVYKHEATCEKLEGYTLVSNKNGICTYEQQKEDVKDVTCPTVNGYTKSSQNGYTCTYTKNITDIKNPICPALKGYTVTRNGMTCNYQTSTTDSKNPECPTVSGYTFSSRNGFTCTYSKQVASDNYTLSYYTSGSGSYVPSDTDTYYYEQTSADYKYMCNNSCSFGWYYTYKVYKKNYTTTTKTTTKTAECPNGYEQSGNTCVNIVSVTTSKPAECPNGYKQENNSCVKYYEDTITKNGTCPSGYNLSQNKCYKTTSSKITKEATCGINETMTSGKCYQDETNKITVVQERDVLYYRYRLREYVGGETDYKWSSSNNDTSLLNNGYVLTGNTREKEEKTYVKGGNK